MTETIEIGGYGLTSTPLQLEDVPRLHELSVSVSWPHRAADWEMLLHLGRGWAARDDIGRIVGSAMWFPYGTDLASIGMVITSPRLQENGAGRWLMRRVFDETRGRVRMLNATKAAFRLYVSLGFKTLATVNQQNGVVGDVPAFAAAARAMRPEDRARILELDRAALGAPRSGVLDAVLNAAEAGTVTESDGRITGFALIRRFGRGRVLGPVVAENDLDAIALCGPLIAPHRGEFLRLDTREPEGDFRRFLTASGIVEYDTVQRMSLEPLPEPQGPARTYGLISQALG
jgi:ribosomal protein S18 acetylase RimI-like enzyme